jgi:hypothetical protein
LAHYLKTIINNPTKNNIMKKIIIFAMALGFAQMTFAQETVTETTTSEKVKVDFYFGVGAMINGDYKINNNLKQAGMSEIESTVPEFSIGVNLAGEKWTADLEVNASYWKKDRNPFRSEAITSSVKLRGHYVPLRTEKFFISAGADLSFQTNKFNFYNRNQELDLNDLDPSTQLGNIQLNNELLYVGPSVAIGLLQNKSTKLRLNFGYDIAAYSSKWKSDYTRVNNSFRENGHDKFYVKLTIL